MSCPKHDSPLALPKYHVAYFEIALTYAAAVTDHAKRRVLPELSYSTEAARPPSRVSSAKSYDAERISNDNTLGSYRARPNR